MQNIIIVFPTSEDAMNIRRLLARSGFQIAQTCASGMRALQTADRIGSGIVVCGYRLRDMLYSDLQRNLPSGFAMLLLASPGALPPDPPEGVSTLAMPFSLQELTGTLRKMEETLDLSVRQRRGGPRERTRREGKIIAQAKSLLMQRNGMSEEEAHRYLQKTSMESGVGMVETAGMILSLMQ